MQPPTDNTLDRVPYPGRPFLILQNLINEIRQKEIQVRATRDRLEQEEATLNRALIQIQAENNVLEKEIKRTCLEMSRAVSERDRRVTASVRPGTEESTVLHQFKNRGLINGRWLAVDFVAKGNHSIVLGGVDMRRSNAVAIRYEPDEARSVCLERDKNVYESLVVNETDDKKGFTPKVRYIGPALHGNVMIMDRLGPSLEEERPFWEHRISQESVMLIGLQLIDRIESLHLAGYVHGNIQPAHILTDWRPNGGYHLINFSSAWNFICPMTRDYRVMTPRANLIGIPRYASVLSHQTHTVDRASDLESLAYVLVEMMTGSLPWTRLDPESPSRYEEETARIIRLKGGLSASEHVRRLPRGMIKYLLALKKIARDQIPDYDLFRSFLSGEVLPAPRSNAIPSALPAASFVEQRFVPSQETEDESDPDVLPETAALPIPMSPTSRRRRMPNTPNIWDITPRISIISSLRTIPSADIGVPVNPLSNENEASQEQEEPPNPYRDNQTPHSIRHEGFAQQQSGSLHSSTDSDMLHDVDTALTEDSECETEMDISNIEDMMTNTQ